MAIVLGLRRYGRYTTVCQLRYPGDASGRCEGSASGMKAGRRWARCTGVRANLRRVATPVAAPILPLVAPPPSRRASTFSLKAVWAYLGRPSWPNWIGLLERAGVPRKRKNGKSSKLTHAECRRVLETRYRELGEQQLKRKAQ